MTASERIANQLANAVDWMAGHPVESFAVFFLVLIIWRVTK